MDEDYQIDDDYDFKPGDLFEDVFYHPCVCMGFNREDDEIWGVSLIDGSYPRACSIMYNPLPKLSPKKAWEMKMAFVTPPENGPH